MLVNDSDAPSNCMLFLFPGDSCTDSTANSAKVGKCSIGAGEKILVDEQEYHSKQSTIAPTPHVFLTDSYVCKEQICC